MAAYHSIRVPASSRHRAWTRRPISSQHSARGFCGSSPIAEGWCTGPRAAIALAGSFSGLLTGPVPTGISEPPPVKASSGSDKPSLLLHSGMSPADMRSLAARQSGVDGLPPEPVWEVVSTVIRDDDVAGRGTGVPAPRPSGPHAGLRDRPGSVRNVAG